MLIAAATAQLLLRLGAGSPATGSQADRFLRGVAFASGALVTMFVAQESVEGLLADGHRSGFAAVAGSGGWLAVPLAIGFGVVVVLLLRAARTIERASWVVVMPRRLLPRPPRIVRPVGLAPHAPRLTLLVGPLRGRAPPLVAI